MAKYKLLPLFTVVLLQIKNGGMRYFLKRREGDGFFVLSEYTKVVAQEVTELRRIAGI